MWSIRCVATLLGVALACGVARAQQPQYYYYPAPAPSPYAYPGPAGPIRSPAAQPFVGSSYGFQSPGSASCYSPATSYYPGKTAFYDLHRSEFPQPGPYYYTRNYPFTNGYYSYYYTPGYFRY